MIFGVGFRFSSKFLEELILFSSKLVGVKSATAAADMNIS